jgi:hypothetical protein
MLTQHEWKRELAFSPTSFRLRVASNHAGSRKESSHCLLSASSILQVSIIGKQFFISGERQVHCRKEQKRRKGNCFKFQLSNRNKRELKQNRRGGLMTTSEEDSTETQHSTV